MIRSISKPLISKIDFRRILILFLIWRGVLLGTSLIADRFFQYAPSFPYSDSILASSGQPRFIYSWAGFDGVHYLTIAKSGYTEVNYIQAFFPLLPAIILRPIHLLSLGSANLVLIGLLFTQIFALLSLLSLFALTKKFFGSKIAWTTLLSFILFPTSFFLGALYTEGLFLFLVFTTFLAASKKKWLLAGSLTLLASATRIVGIFLVPALLLELYLTVKPTGSLFENTKAFIRAEIKNICFIMLGCLGLFGYMFYLHNAVGDALAFFHVQSAFGAGRQTSLVIYPQVVFRALKILLTSPLDMKYIAYLQEFIAGTLGLLAILIGYKHSRPGWILFALSAFFLPPLTGTFSSMSRYLLVCYPLFVFLGFWLNKHPKARIIWFLVSAALLLLNATLFIQGYWVA